jgi:hypothetical protein
VWSRISRHEFGLVSLLNGNRWVHLRLPRIGVKNRYELPVSYTVDVAYHREKWSLFTEGSRGLDGDHVLAGLEYRLGAVELRGGTRYSQGKWYPSGGAGFNLTRTLGVDAALFGTRTFLEEDTHIGLAVSFRIDKRNPDE